MRDRAVIQRIIAAIAPQPEQTLVEIGPGQGAITLPLLAICGRLHAIELDRDLLVPLQQTARDHGELILHQGDALRLDFCALRATGPKLRVLGNLPYNISTPLLFHLLSQAECLEDMHFMLQKEVVTRLAAQPGQAAYGRLSVMIQYRCSVQPLFDIEPTAFWPAPKVTSAFVRLIPHQIPPVAVEDETVFARVVQQAFAQRRKTLRNTLKGLLSAESIAQLGIDPQTRAEQLDLAAFAQLSNRVAQGD